MIGATAINHVILMGRLTATPELKQTTSGISVCRFTVAVTRAFKENDEYKSDFISCIAWRQTAEFISRNFTKGRLILLEGSLRTGSYDDRNHPDVKHYTTDIYVDNVGFGETKSHAGADVPEPTPPPERKSSTQSQSQPQSVADLGDFEEVVSDPDLPF